MLIFLYDVIIYDVSVTPSTLKTFMKFWGTCFKFWLHPWSLCQQEIVFLALEIGHLGSYEMKFYLCRPTITAKTFEKILRTPLLKRFLWPWKVTK